MRLAGRLFTPRAYVPRLMLRQILTLFALLSGLAASPAGAEMRDARAETRVEATSEIVVVAQAVGPRDAQVEAGFQRENRLPDHERAAPPQPATLIGIDRARE